MLDISILNVTKYLTSDKRKIDFLYNPVSIEEKFDGVKVSLFHVNNTGDYTKDFILAYKTNIIYPNEFDYVVKSKVRRESINNSQFLYLFDILKDFKGQLPLNYEFFIEFLMNKPTLSHQYKRLGAVLIAYSKTSYEIKFDRIFSKPQGFNTENRESYAKLLGLDSPKTLFKGILANFESGIKNQALKAEYLKYKNTLNINNVDDYIAKISNMLLALDSKYGGKPEGFVFNFQGFSLKLQQVYQTDQLQRTENKNKFRGSETEETEYWRNVRLAALDLIGNLNYKDVRSALNIISPRLRDYKLAFTHPKKTIFQIKDDIQGNIKMILIKRQKGNNNFLFIGKFRILTNAHYNIIKQGLKDFDNGVVCLISNNETLKYEKLRIEMLRRCFPEVSIMTRRTGNLIGIINDSKLNINAVLCGSDRYASYKQQLIKNPDISVLETKRSDTDISATKIVENLDNYIYFKRNTPKMIHSMYDEILKVFKSQ